jgi:exosortase
MATPTLSASPNLSQEAVRGRTARDGLAAAFLGILVSVLYWPVISDLAIDWWTDDASSYGMLMPLVAGYIAWLKRKSILSIPAQEDGRGLAVVVGACLMLLVGKLGAEFFLSRLSFVVLLAGLVWLFWGLPRLRQLVFPLLLLATMVPLPTLVYNQMSIPLQLFASTAAASIIQFLGGTVYRDGNILQLPGLTLGVAEACSGLHSLAALCVAALLVGYIACNRLPVRAVLFILAIPLAIALNVFRITGTALLAMYRESFAMGFYHSFSGWLVFVVSFGLLVALARGLHRVLD